MTTFSTARVREVMRNAGLPDTDRGYREACAILGRRAAAAKRARNLRNGGRLREQVEAERYGNRLASGRRYWWEMD